MKIIDLISDIELRLTRGNVSGDFQIDRRQIRFWLDIVRERLVKDNQLKGMNTDMVGSVVEYPCVDIEKIELPCGIGCKKYRYSVKLPVKVMDVVNDMGVYNVETESGVQLKRISALDIQRIQKLKFARPNEFNIVYARVGDSLNLYGGTESYKKGGKVNLYLIPQNTDSLSDESEYPIEGSLLMQLLEEVEKIGRRELGTIEDVESDGKQQ